MAEEPVGQIRYIKFKKNGEGVKFNLKVKFTPVNYSNRYLFHTVFNIINIYYYFILFMMLLQEGRTPLHYASALLGTTGGTVSEPEC